MKIHLFFGVVILFSEFQNSTGIFDGWWEIHSSRDVANNYTVELLIDIKEVLCTKEDNFTILYTIDGDLLDCVTLTVVSDPRNITTIPDPVQVCPDDVTNGTSYNVSYHTFHEGKVNLLTQPSESNIIFTDDAFVSVSASLNPAIDVVGDVIGWIYTIAWDASFIPQIWHNYRRQSVIGLSFDFLTLNFIGFSCYALFNIGLYWIPAIQDEYYMKYPTSILHVRLNDVIFPIYAVICTALQISQCFIYERGNQRVSTICRIISGFLIIVAVIYAILVGVLENIWWIDFLYVLSYIKLAITCIKYLPQLYENYKNKSTEGWSIWQVILDFTGGSLSLLQMFLLAYNYDDFHSVLTDPSKLGLGLLSVFFNIFFFLQHYVLYRHKKIEDPKEKKLEIQTLYNESKDKTHL